MCVYPFSDISASMPKDASLCGFVGTGIIQQCCYGMAAIVGGVSGSIDQRHDMVPLGTEPAVIIRVSVRSSDKGIAVALQSGGDKSYDG